MKIIEVVANFPPYFGGIGNSCLRFSEELIKRGHEVEVYTSRYPNEPYEYVPGLVVHRLPYQFRYGNAPLTIGLFKIRSADVIHLHYPYYFGAEIVYVLSKLRGIPYVVTYHMDMVGTGLLKHIFRLHRKLFLTRLLKGAERIYVSSLDYAQNSDLAGISEIQNRIVVVPFGVDVTKFLPSARDSKLQGSLGLSPSEKVVAFVGQLDRPHYFKGLSVLLEAFAGLEDQTVKLLVIGDGDMRVTYETEAEALGIATRVVFAGAVDNDQLSHYINLGDFLVLPSIDKTESFGMVLLEAQATSRGVVASNFPGVRSVVVDGRDGLLTKPRDKHDLADKMTYLFENPVLIEQFGQNGRAKVVAQYSWERVTETLSNDLEALTSQST